MNKIRAKTILLVVLLIISISIVLIALASEHSSFQEQHITTSYGDEFVISVHDYLGKASISNAEYRFGAGIPYYNEGDSITELCDTPNITCYEINGLTICKLKAIDKMFLFNSSIRNDEEIYKCLTDVLSNDIVARQYIKEEDLSISGSQ